MEENENETYKINVNSNKYDNIKIEIKKIENSLDFNLFFIENFIKKLILENLV